MYELLYITTLLIANWYQARAGAPFKRGGENFSPPAMIMTAHASPDCSWLNSYRLEVIPASVIQCRVKTQITRFYIVFSGTPALPGISGPVFHS